MNLPHTNQATSLAKTLRERSRPTTIEPLGDRVLVKQTEAEDRTPGGILLPEASKTKPREGTVVSVGRGRTTEDGTLAPMYVKAGDRVLFHAYGATEVKHLGVDLLVMSEGDILGIVR